MAAQLVASRAVLSSTELVRSLLILVTEICSLLFERANNVRYNTSHNKLLLW
jgi:hypothetical protein